jgi:non-canonical poly(A) RNA polymerase PAPD5/7
LHKELIDFYNWVKPQDYEKEVRADLLNRLTLAFRRIEPGGQLKAFGSYAAGLYLPVGDMDLVFLTKSFQPGRTAPSGLPPKPAKKLLYRFSDLLRNQRIAVDGSVTVIPFAKVPIVKFVDARTGLRVDLSFDNDSGLIANETFQLWKTAYPTMPILVSIIKQFLMIRGWNDVSTGGLGGFSIICLVTSLVQHMPGIGPSPNLGEMLVEFFNIYGNLLDRDSVAIRLDPPGYIDKVSISTLPGDGGPTQVQISYKPMLFTRDKPGRLTIIDPNRPENNISGGTTLIEGICDSFARAHQSLHHRLNQYEKGEKSESFLKDLIGGDFKSYDHQRQHLSNVYFGLTGQEPAPRQRPVTTQSVSSPAQQRVGCSSSKSRHGPPNR